MDTSVTGVLGAPPADCLTACPVASASTTGTASSTASRVSNAHTQIYMSIYVVAEHNIRLPERLVSG